MKKLIFVSVLPLLIFSFCNAQTLDEILEEHYAVMGQENLNKVESIKILAKAINGPNEIPVAIYAKRPGKVRIEVDIQGQIMIQAIDGDDAWQIIPWSGTTDPMEITGPQVKGLKWLADIDGQLYNYQDKGFTAELLEDEEEYEGTPVYKIRLEDKDGDKLTYVIDADTYILLARIISMKIQGQEIEQAENYSAYEMQNGIAWAMEQETLISGQPQRQSRTDSIVLNLPMEDALFVKPEIIEKEVPEEQPE